MREIGSLVLAGGVMVVLGLVMQFSPILYGVTLYQLNTHERPWRYVKYLAGGLGSGALVLLLAFRTFNPDELLEYVRGGVHALLVQRWVDLGVGVLFVLAGLVELLRSLRPYRPPEPAVEQEARTPTGLFAFGLVSAGLSTNRILVTYATGRIVARATALLPLQLALYLLFVGTMVAPYLLSSWAWGRFPRVSHRIQEGFDALIAWDSRRYVAAALVGIGAGFFWVAYHHVPFL